MAKRIKIDNTSRSMTATSLCVWIQLIQETQHYITLTVEGAPANITADT
jgi:hypothetical protein